MILNFSSLHFFKFKKHVFVASFFLLTICAVYAQSSKPFLEINGKALNNKEKQINPLQISVYENGFKLYSFESKAGIKLTFESNRYYSILINAKGFQSSTLIVDSSVPKKKEKENFRFEFEYQLIEDSDTSKIETSELPAAIIKYNTIKKGFSISDKYNSYRKELNQK